MTHGDFVSLQQQDEHTSAAQHGICVKVALAFTKRKQIDNDELQTHQYSTSDVVTAATIGTSAAVLEQ